MQRRNILKAILGAGAAFIAAPVVYAVGRFVSHTAEPVADGAASVKASELMPSKLIKVGSEPVIVLKEKDGDIRAFTATCTHLKCIVSYRPDMDGFYCKCHKGRYDANGVNIPGTRPKRPLTELTVNKDGETLTISLAPLHPKPAA